MAPERWIGYDKSADTFHVGFTPSQALIADVHDLPGREYDPSRGIWTVPATSRSAAIAVRLLGRKHNFLCQRVAMDKIVSLEGNGRKLLAASRAVDASVDVPGLRRKLRPYQRAGVCYCQMADFRVIIADEMGVGKTLQAIAAVELAQAYPALVVCPASAKYNWADELAIALPHRSVNVINSGQGNTTPADITVINYDLLADGWMDVASIFHPEGMAQREARELLQSLGIVVGGYDRPARRLRNCIISPTARRTFNEATKEQPWRVEKKGRRVALSAILQNLIQQGLSGLVLDEVHYLGNPGSQRTSAIMDLVKILGAKLRVRLGLSGTPINNQVKEWIPILKILGRLDDVGGWHTMTKRYCGAYQANWGWVHPDADPEALHLREFNEVLRSTCMIRRRKIDVLKDLPPKTRVKVLVDLDLPKEYRKAEQETASWLSMQPSPAETLVRLGTLRSLASKAMIPVAIQWITDFLESGQKLLVFALSRDVQQAIYERFRDISVRVHGDDSPATRFAQVQRFQAEPAAQMIVISLKAGREALNITAGPNELFVDLDWTSTAHDQAEDRSWRSGQTHPVTAYYLVGKGTIYEDIWDVIERKRGIVSATSDGNTQADIVQIAQHLSTRFDTLK